VARTTRATQFSNVPVDPRHNPSTKLGFLSPTSIRYLFRCISLRAAVTAAPLFSCFLRVPFRTPPTRRRSKSSEEKRKWRANELICHSFALLMVHKMFADEEIKRLPLSFLARRATPTAALWPRQWFGAAADTANGPLSPEATRGNLPNGVRVVDNFAGGQHRFSEFCQFPKPVR